MAWKSYWPRLKNRLEQAQTNKQEKWSSPAFAGFTLSLLNMSLRLGVYKCREKQDKPSNRVIALKKYRKNKWMLSA